MRNNYHNSQQSEQSVKISRSKSRNQMAIVTKLKSKENGWNDRFHLQHIPQYNYLNEPHSQYLKHKFKIPNRKDKPSNDPARARKPEPSLEKKKVSNRPNPKRNEEKLKQAIDKAFSDLKSLWYQKAIPQCHMELMTKILNRENNPMKILDDIKMEFSDITKQISLVQKIVASIETRENCLQKIKELEKLFEQENNQKIIKLFEQKISHLRILTIHCIQCIFQWKQSFEHTLPKGFKVIYLHSNLPYTLKIKQDYKEITESRFKQLFSFDSKKIDAFFLNYSIDGKKISNVSKNLVKRIRLCQMLLSQSDEGQQQSNRTPIIKNMNSPNIGRQDKSMPPIMKNKIFTPWKKVSVEYGQFNQYFNNLLKKSHFVKSFLPFVQIAKFQQITFFQYGETGQEIILAADKNSPTRKLIILGIKATHDTLQISLKSLCEFLWENDNCTQIRMSLLHQQIGESFSVDAQLQKKIKGVGFRWVSVNHNNDERMTIYGMKRPLNAAQQTSKRSQAYPVIIEHLTVFALAQNNQKKISNSCLAGVLELLSLLKETKTQDYEQICKRDQFSHHLDCLKRISDYMQKQALKEGIAQFQTKFTYSGLKGFEVESEDKLSKIFHGLEIASQQVATTFPAYISLLNTSFKFKNIIINDGKFTKFFPTKDNEILICESNYPIYLLQSDEENINFFIIEVEDNFSMDSIDSIFHAMGDQSSFIDEFWLPTFNKSLNYIDQVSLVNRQLISTDYRSCLGSLTRKSKVRTKVIRAPFVFGMINKKLLEMLEIPFYCTLVRKSDLIDK